MIYHSHIDAGAYFSETDRRNALIDGQPAYPEATYVVVAVDGGPRAETRGLFSAGAARVRRGPARSATPPPGQKTVDGSEGRCYHPPALVKERTCLLGPP